MHDRLLPFLAQLKDDKIPAAGIVRMANGGKGKHLPPITIDDVNAARAELSAGSAGAVPPPETSSEEPKPTAAEEPAPPEPEPPGPVPEPEPEPVPATVIVTAGGHRTLHNGPDRGRPFHTSFSSVYSGHEAAWLWESHRSLVETFKPKKG